MAYEAAATLLYLCLKFNLIIMNIAVMEVLV